MVSKIGRLQKISRKIGFTEIESKIILFLLSAFFIGLIINIIKDKAGNENLLQFDYRNSDNEFYKAEYITDSTGSNEKIIKNGFDSKLELLDFSGENFSEKQFKDSAFSVKIVDINAATVKQLVSLPGIGPKTAQAIVDYRLRYGNYVNINDLMNVKGIGKVKLNKIRKNIIIK